MFKTLRDAWSIPEIRKKLLYTLLMLLIFRLGSAVVVPFLDTSTVSTWMASNATGGNFLEYLDIITGGALSQATVLSLSITPYINASIIMQLLTYALPPLERMRDEGEEGQKKLNKITAAVSLALSVFMSFAYYLTLKVCRTLHSQRKGEYTVGETKTGKGMRAIILPKIFHESLMKFFA